MSEDTGSALSRDLLGYAEANQVIQGNRHRGDGSLKLVGDRGDTCQRFLLHVLMNTQCRRRCASDCLNTVSIFCKEGQNLFCSISGGARRDLRPFEKKSQPLFPGTVCSYALKQIVVPVAVRFEVQAEVQKRLSQGTLGAKQECDQQTPESTIAIQEGVNGLKLHVNQSGLDQDGQLVFLVMEKTLKTVETLHQSLGRRRNERSITR